MAAQKTEVTEPGIYLMPADVYHADPVPGRSLSSSGVKMLLPPSCPALFKYHRDHPTDDAPAHFDFGHAAHRLVLGAGPKVTFLDFKDWRTNAAKEARDAAHAAGEVPLLEHDRQVIEDMAAALLSHPRAAELFRPGLGLVEQSLFWRDERTGVFCRARLDWLEVQGHIIADDKTTVSAAPERLQRAMYEYGYHTQSAWYLRAVKGVNYAGRYDSTGTAYVLVAQEKTPPYLVTVAEPTTMALRIGEDNCRKALELYRRCAERNEWPGYSSDIEYLSLPAWVENAYIRESE